VSEPWLARQQRQLAYLAEFASDVQHIPGVQNVVVDALSPPGGGGIGESSSTPGADPSWVETRPGQPNFNRPGPQSSTASFQCSSLVAVRDVDFAEMAAEQRRCSECKDMQFSSSLAVSVLKSDQYELLCDFSLGSPRPLVPKACRAAVFAAIHGVAHPGICATKRLLSSRFVWPRMASDITQMCRDCVDCQRSKVVRHVRAPVQPIELPPRRFAHLHVDIVGPFPVSAAGHHYLFTVIEPRRG
jgi:hypothetical protein